MAHYEKLTGEISRVVKSPYPTQLKGLHDLVRSECTTEDIDRWACSWPCQTRPLAHEVLCTSQRWTYGIELLAQLCCSDMFRDSCLELDPQLLPNAIRRALADTEDKTIHMRLCIALLSRELPININLPTECQDLLHALVDQACRDNDEQSVKDVYLILQGSSLGLISVLSHDKLSDLENRLLDILGNTASAEGSRYGLYALSAMQSLIRACDSASCPTTPASVSSDALFSSRHSTTIWKPTKIAEFFTGKKAHKTLQLLVLRVMYACRMPVSDKIKDLHTTVTLAQQILNSIPSNICKEWCKQNDIIVRKLEQKLQQPHLDTTLRFFSTVFLMEMSSNYEPSNDVLQSYGSTWQLLAIGSKLNPQSMDRMISKLQMDHISTLLAQLPLLIATAKPAKLLSLQAVPKSILRSVQQHMTSLSKCDSTFFNLVTSNTFSSDLERLQNHLIDLVNQPIGSTCDEACASATSEAKRYLSRVLCGFVFHALVIVEPLSTNIGATLTDLFTTLIELSATATQEDPGHAHSVQTVSHCDRRAYNYCSALTNTSSWREGIYELLGHGARQDHAALVAHFEQACHDLETRCSDVETPLRALQEENDTLKAKHTTLLDAQTIQHQEQEKLQIRLNHSEAQYSTTSSELAQCRLQNESLVEQVTSLERRLQSTAEESKSELSKTQSNFEIERLEYAITTAQQQERLDSLQKQFDDRGRDLKSRDHQIMELQNQAESQQSNISSLQQEIEVLRSSEDDYKRQREHLQSSLDDIQQRQQLANQEIDKLNRLLNDQEQSNAQALLDVRTGCERQADLDLHQLNAKYTQQLLDKDNEMAKLLAEHTEKATNMSDALQAASETTRRLEDKQRKAREELRALRRACAEKDANLAASLIVRERMMAAMGITMATDLPIMPPTQADDMETVSEPSQAASGLESEINIDIKPATPATTATRRMTYQKAASVARPVHRRALSNTHDRSAARQPLQPMHNNVSPRVSGRNSASQRGCKDYNNIEDGTTFEDSDLLSGTPE